MKHSLVWVLFYAFDVVYNVEGSKIPHKSPQLPLDMCQNMQMMLNNGYCDLAFESNTTRDTTLDANLNPTNSNVEDKKRNCRSLPQLFLDNNIGGDLVNEFRNLNDFFKNSHLADILKYQLESMMRPFDTISESLQNLVNLKLISIRSSLSFPTISGDHQHGTATNNNNKAAPEEANHEGLKSRDVEILSRMISESTAKSKSNLELGELKSKTRSKSATTKIIDDMLSSV